MRIIITDTNIFVDILSINALTEFFELDYEITTTIFVIREILLTDQKEQIETIIKSGKLHIIEFNADELLEIRAFHTNRSFKGITDKTVLWVSHKLNCPLITGDGKLRKEAHDLNITVYGTLWVIQQLFEKLIVTKETAIQMLETLKISNFSLPHDQIDRMIRGFRA